MNLKIDPAWLLRMAEKETNGIISVGGLVCRINPEAIKGTTASLPSPAPAGRIAPVGGPAAGVEATSKGESRP